MLESKAQQVDGGSIVDRQERFHERKANESSDGSPVDHPNRHHQMHNNSNHQHQHQNQQSSSQSISQPMYQAPPDNSNRDAVLYGMLAGLLSLIFYASIAMNCYCYFYVYRRRHLEPDVASKPSTVIGNTQNSNGSASEITENLGQFRSIENENVETEPVFDPYQIEFKRVDVGDDGISAIGDASLGLGGRFRSFSQEQIPEETADIRPQEAAGGASLGLGAFLHAFGKGDMFGRKRSSSVPDIETNERPTDADEDAKSVDSGFATHTSEWFRGQIERRKKEHKDTMDEALSKPVETEPIFTPRPGSGFIRTRSPTDTENTKIAGNLDTQEPSSSNLYNSEWAKCLKPLPENDENPDMGRLIV